MNSVDRLLGPTNCFSWSHSWKAWTDEDVLEAKKAGTDILTEKHIVQHRRCERCNRLEIRLVTVFWSY